VNWQDAHECSSHTRLQFKGAGSTPQEQLASMQRQLSAMCSSTGFLAPESWPASSCLTSYTYAEGLDRDDGDDVYMQAAARTPSLAHLEVDGGSTSNGWLLGGLSILQRLTSITLSSGLPCGTLDEELIEGVGQLGSLQRLHIDLHLLDAGEEDEGDEEGEGNEGSRQGFVIPESWSALSSLTKVSLSPSCEHRNWEDGEPCLLAAQLSRLVAVEDLRLSNNLYFCRGGMAVGAVSSLFALTRLTSLVGPFKFSTQDDDVARGEAASRGLDVPKQWRDRLQRLEWRYSTGTVTMLPQLTSLTSLKLEDVCISPQLCRCELQGSPSAAPCSAARYWSDSWQTTACQISQFNTGSQSHATHRPISVDNSPTVCSGVETCGVCVPATCWAS
jgi:hypothetical protein